MKVWRPSASALQRSLNCESSCTLDRSPEEPRGHAAPSSVGNRIHAALEVYRYGGRMEDVLHKMLPTDCPGFEFVLKEIPKIEPLMGLPTAEVECWLSPQTLEAELGTSGVPIPDGWYRGMADVIGTCAYDGVEMPCVMDYKSGSPRHQVGPDAAQLAYFVLWLHIKTGAEQIASIVFLTKDATQPRLHIWQKADIDAFAQRFAALAAKLDMVEAGLAEPTLAKNKDCFFCPCRSVCPLWQQPTKESPASMDVAPRDIQTTTLALDIISTPGAQKDEGQDESKTDLQGSAAYAVSDQATDIVNAKSVTSEQKPT